MFNSSLPVNQELLTHATIAFSSEFYDHIKGEVTFSPKDIVVVQAEYEVLALSVVNTCIGLRRKNPNALLLQNTRQCLQVYGHRFEGITKGRVSAQSYAAGLLKEISGGAAEYSHILSSPMPEQHSEKIVRCFQKRAMVQFSSDTSFLKACGKMTDMLNDLIDNLKKAGV